MPRQSKDNNKSSFISLKDFMLLGRVDDHTIVDEYNTGPGWIKLYDGAKKQYKLFGNNPPIGANVVTVRSGLGGPVGIVKKITGIESYGSKEMFVLDRSENDSYQENLSYLVDKETWWAYFAVIPFGDNNGKKNKKKAEPESIL